ncbi:hypothetical protein [Aeromonas taiwanensis]|uniref:hypothetical protein n=1 Tax=Aeromonas taiwanensis TaxID=633417 RepID=UPI003BA07C04
MQFIYELIQENPKFYAWAFGVVNALWLLFAYFNKQRHERDLKRLEQDLRYKADRRLKIFDLKASEYAKYVTDLDSFGKKNQIEMPERLQPIFDEYLQNSLAATEAEDKEQERRVIGWFSSQISALMQEGLKDVLKLKSESNRLKLIATEDMLQTFDRLEKLTQESMDCTNEYMKNFTEIFLHQQNYKTDAFQQKAAELASQIELESKNLLNQMRSELSDI